MSAISLIRSIRQRADPNEDVQTAPPDWICQYCQSVNPYGWRCQCQDSPENPLGHWFCVIVAFWGVIGIAWYLMSAPPGYWTGGK